MIAIDDSGAFLGDIFFINDSDVSEEKMSGVPSEQIYS